MILRFIIAAILLYLLYRIGRRFFLPAGKKVKPLSRDQQNEGRVEDLVEDPQCHAYVPMGEAFALNRDGKTYYFCSRSCLEQYEKAKMPKSEDV